jgi:hypothetical protein
MLLPIDAKPNATVFLFPRRCRHQLALRLPAGTRSTQAAGHARRITRSTAARQDEVARGALDVQREQLAYLFGGPQTGVPLAVMEAVRKRFPAWSATQLDRATTLLRAPGTAGAMGGAASSTLEEELMRREAGR